MTGHWADVVSRFTTDWRRGGTPPRLADYVPDDHAATVVRAAVLTDLVRVDLRHRWEHEGTGRTVADYRTEFPEMGDGPELVELICAEYDARRARGPLPLDEFLDGYPELAEPVRERLTARAHAADAAVIVLDRPPDQVVPGQRVDDFDLLTTLDTDGSTRGFVARQLSMQRLVAVRLTTGSEPRPVARLDHPHIVRVFDHKPIMSPSGPARLVYTQYLPGGTAADLLDRVRTGPVSAGGALLLRSVDAAMERRGEIRPADSRVRASIAAMSWPETVAWLGGRLAEALDHADRHGLRYRVITPADVLFGAEGEPALADTTAERADTVAAIPYRAPEHSLPGPDQRAGIFSLGVLLWELLTGSRPHVSDSGIDARDLRRLPPDCPAALRRVLLTCLETDPARRWSDGAALARQLDLCLDQRARDLVDPPEHSARLRLRAWRIPIITLAILIPNVLASLYNIEFHRLLLVTKLSEESARRLDIGAAIANGIGFGFGTAALVYLARYLIFVPYGLRRGRNYPDELMRRARADTILFGDRAIVVVFSMWLLTGLSFPIVISGTTDAVTAYDYTQFVVSHVICGAVALVYPFFLVDFYVTRCVYPMFLRRGEGSAEDAHRLRGLRRRAGFWLVVAVSIPLATVAGASLLTPADLAQIIVEVRILALGSVIAVIGVYALFRALEADLRALERVQSPAPGGDQDAPP